MLKGLLVVVSMFLMSLQSSSASDDVVADKDMSNINIIKSNAKILRLTESARSIIVGNPTIADISMQNSKTLVISAYRVGTTNLIILNNNSEKIFDAKITVSPNEESIVFMHRATKDGLARNSYSCTPKCELTANVGDEASSFSQAQSQNENIKSTADSAARNNRGQN